MNPSPTRGTDPYASTGADSALRTHRQQATPPSPDRANRVMAVVALVLASLGLLFGLGACGMSMVAMDGVDQAERALGLGDAPPEDAVYTGRAPGVSVHETYPGTRLAKAVTTALQETGATVGALTCDDTLEVGLGAEARCEGVVDGEGSVITVLFEDDDGHFMMSAGT